MAHPPPHRSCSSAATSPARAWPCSIEAFGHLPADVRLWIASEGPETARLRQATADEERIEWLGQIGEQEKIRRIRGADVLCAPSLHGESFGVVLLEGMAAGTPVVASDLAGYRNVARPGRRRHPHRSWTTPQDLAAALEARPRRRAA